MLCRASRLIGYALTGHDKMLCTLAHERDWPLRHVLDALCAWRDGPDHCMRMFLHDERTR